IFVGGSNVAAGVELLEAVKKTFFGPMRVSVLFDANGANTTAAAAVLAAAKHVSLDGARALVLAGTGPVGQRAARLLARQGAQVRIASRDRARSQKVADELQARIGGARFDAVQTSTADETAKALEDVQIVIAAGAAGVELLSESSRQQASALQVAIDLNAVPPLGIGGLKVTDKAESRDGVICYGAIGVGGTKMKIHKAALRRLFEANDQVLDAEEVYAIGEGLG
ncbi:MAG: saccharopine dehydrogenase NADP-binding domain-containing protein, partial [Planctomycetales bacterium]|nr:saccharopine dehydrogenase NADP-binding domain-containing protein [Planctomycetales bacterium]